MTENKTRKTDSVRAHEAGIKQLKNAKAVKRWSYAKIAIEAYCSESPVKRFFNRQFVNRQSALAICKALGLDIDEIVEEKKVEQNDTEPTPATAEPETKAATSQNWREICQTMLNRGVSSNLLTGKEGVCLTDVDSIYVDLALVERRQQEKRQGNILAPEGSNLYHSREYEEKQRFEHQQFLRQILGDGVGKTQGRRVAIIGEPGAGKTTTLQKIAAWLLSANESASQSEQKREDYLPIWVSLAGLADQDLEEYLVGTWLKQAIGQFQLTPEVQQEFCQQIQQGRFWLLLDGLDEMPIGDRGLSAREKIHRQLQGWMSSVRVVVSCRVNLWEADNNALADFETYRMLDFDDVGLGSFIEKFFRQQENLGKGEKLQAELHKPEYQRLRDLVKNPLRLMLLCTIWESSSAKLPETQAELYQGFVKQIYIWKKDKFPTTQTQRDELNRGLKALALRGLEDATSPFRLSHDLVRDVLGDREEETSLFFRGLKLGWLNEVGVAAEDVTQTVYSFYHATFQEYFAALAVDDWGFFLYPPSPPLPRGGELNCGLYPPAPPYQGGVN